MASKPILFNTEMVKAILDGRKTQTRRIAAEKIYLDKEWGLDREPYFKNGKWYYNKQTAVDDSKCYEMKPKYQVGDILWVRETWEYIGPDDLNPGRFIYRASPDKYYPIFEETITWHPSIHMPREAARIFLRVTNVRVERVQEMNGDDLEKEGIKTGIVHSKSMFNCFGNAERYEEAQKKFSELWNSTIKKQDLDIYGWNANPWVWVYEFERVSEDGSSKDE